MSIGSKYALLLLFFLVFKQHHGQFIKPSLVMVDACGSAANEWRNEFFTFDVGDNPVDLANIFIQTNWQFCQSFCAPQVFVSNSAYLASLNATAGCAGDLFFAAPSTLPANAKVLVMTGPDPTFVYDFSSECEFGPIYVIFLTHTNIGEETFTNGIDDGEDLSFVIDFITFETVNFAYNLDEVTGLTGDFVEYTGSYEYGVTDVTGVDLIYQNDGSCLAPLPVELINFSGKQEGDLVNLAWTTASESNSHRFVVQRSADGITFEDIGSVPALGNSTSEHTYQFEDTEPLEGVAYYRLNQIDFDGANEHLELIAVYFGYDAFGIANLTINQDRLEATIMAPNSAALVIEVTDVLGRVEYRHSITQPQAKESFSFQFNSSAKGLFFLKVQNEHQADVKKFMLR